MVHMMGALVGVLWHACVEYTELACCSSAANRGCPAPWRPQARQLTQVQHAGASGVAIDLNLNMKPWTLLEGMGADVLPACRISAWALLLYFMQGIPSVVESTLGRCWTLQIQLA